MKILVPYDGSSFSNHSLEFVASRTSLLGHNPEIRLLVVLENLPGRGAALIAPDSMKAYIDDLAQQVLEPARQILKKHNLKVEEHVLQGKPAEVIAQEAEDFGADLIVMGSRGRTAFAGLFMGSVTTGVLARTKLPVLMLRGDKIPEADSLRVGLCVDGSDYGEAAAQFAASHKELFGNAAEYSLLSVMPVFENAGQMPQGLGVPLTTADDVKKVRQEAFAKNTETVKPILEQAQIQAKDVPLVGNAGDEIAGYAKDHLDLIVMGSHGYGRFKSALMGSTAMRIASQGNVPILIIRK